MARRILDFDNPTPEDSDYIYGNIKDDDGSGDGTPMNVKTFGDIFQFFQRLMDKAGITPNRLPDNNYNGFQLYQALENLFAPINAVINATDDSWHIVGSAGEPAFQNSWTSATQVRFRKNGKMIYIMGRASNSGSLTTTVFTLPSGYRPSAETLLVSMEVGSVNTAYSGEVDTSGNVTLASTGSNKNLLFFLGFPIF